MKIPSSDPNATFRAALTHFEKKRFAHAHKLLLQISRTNGSPDALRLLGAVCSEMKKHDEAIAHFNKVVRLAPLPLDYFNLGKAYQLAGDFKNALQAHGAGLARAPTDPHLLQGRALTLSQLGRFEEAAAVYHQLLKLHPDFGEANANFGDTLLSTDRAAEARDYFRRALQVDRNNVHALNGLVLAKLNTCDWEELDSLVQRLVSAAYAGKNAFPFTLLTINDQPETHLAAARAKSADTGGSSTLQRSISASSPIRDRIRVAYVSADYRIHPMSSLIVGLLEAHDRQKFEIIAVSTGKNDGSKIRERIVAAVDQFIDLSGSSILECVHRIRQLDVDIAVDLMGYSRESIDWAFQNRLAPIQVNFQGYPGTTAIEAMDYIVLDPQIATAKISRNVTEKVVLLPDCYQPNDPKRARPDNPLSRKDYGLPETGVVFACFNNAGKLTPEIFSAWVRILARVSGSVLWLSVTNEVARANLREEAERRGISPDRLIFADRLPSHEQHLARYLVADVFLDTFPYGAHTTGSEALWMGCPIIALAGESFPSRVAASLLHNVGLPELITTSLEEYEHLATKLALEPEILAKHRSHLNQCRETAPLFDAASFARNLERAYFAMWKRSSEGKRSQMIDLRKRDVSIGGN